MKTIIYIDGAALSRFRSFEFHQVIFGHHSFALAIDAETLDGKENYLFENSKNLIGTYLTIVSELAGNDNDRLEFEGIITNISRCRYGGHNGKITLSGFSEMGGRNFLPPISGIKPAFFVSSLTMYGPEIKS